MEKIKIDLLKYDEIFGPDALDVIKKYGPLAAITDFAIGTGGIYEHDYTQYVPDDNSLKGRVGIYYTSTLNNDYVRCAYNACSNTIQIFAKKTDRSTCIRPVLELPEKLFNKLKTIARICPNGTYEVEFGEYPQWAPDEDMQVELTKKLKSNKNLRKDKKYTVNAICVDATDTTPFKESPQNEYLYHNKKYVYTLTDVLESQLNECEQVQYSNFECDTLQRIWFEISPITWLLDFEKKRLISKRCLVSGIRFSSSKAKNDGNIEETEMYQFLNNYMLPEILQSVDFKKLESLIPKKYYNVTPETIDNFESMIESSDLSKEELEELKCAIEEEKGRGRK